MKFVYFSMIFTCVLLFNQSSSAQESEPYIGSLENLLKLNREDCQNPKYLKRACSELITQMKKPQAIAVIVEELEYPQCDETLEVILSTIEINSLFSLRMAKALWTKLSRISSISDNCQRIALLLANDKFASYSAPYFVHAIIMLPEEHKENFVWNDLSYFTKHFKRQLLSLIQSEPNKEFKSNMIQEIAAKRVDQIQYLKLLKETFESSTNLELRSACAFRISTDFALQVPTTYFNEFYKQNKHSELVCGQLFSRMFGSRFAVSLLPLVLPTWAALIERRRQPYSVPLLAKKTYYILENYSTLKADQILFIQSHLKPSLVSSDLSFLSTIFGLSVKVSDYSEFNLTVYRRLRKSNNVDDRRNSCRFLYCNYWKTHDDELKTILESHLHDHYPDMIIAGLRAIEHYNIRPLDPSLSKRIVQLAHSKKPTISNLAHKILAKQEN